MLELSPQWQGSSGTSKRGKEESAVKDGGVEEPLIGDSQWRRLNELLEKQVGDCRVFVSCTPEYTKDTSKNEHIACVVMA